MTAPLGVRVDRPVRPDSHNDERNEMSKTYPCERCNMDEGSPFCLQDQRCPGRATAAAKEALELSEHMNDRNNALRLYVSDLTTVMTRMIAGIDHLSELARQWEPDHSSGADRRGWALAKDARNDALRLLQEHSQRIGA